MTTLITTTLPAIIQGGMGAGISGWKLAHAVSTCGQLGVVSGVGLDGLLLRRLQDSGQEAAYREAISHFPIPAVVESLKDWLHAVPRQPGKPYRTPPMHGLAADSTAVRLTMVGAFAEVWLAKAGHSGVIGINLLTKIQLPTLPTLYGAMLAGVDVVLMGAGIPREIPAAISRLVNHEAASLRLDLCGMSPGAEPPSLHFDPAMYWNWPKPVLRRPAFVPIVSSHVLATALVRKSGGGIDGLVVEGPSAGGHNAPPRARSGGTDSGDIPGGGVDLAKIRSLGVPFWLAGGMGAAGSLARAHSLGAAGIQVGTLFAYCDESGMDGDLRRSVLDHAARGQVQVRTDMRASPTGYPFKIVEWPEDPSVGYQRRRVCDLGYLREAYLTPSGEVGFRCSGEPVDAYLRKGGRMEDTGGRRCLCNALLATAGFPQVRENGTEQPVITSGDELIRIAEFLRGSSSYRARQVIDYLM